jgi:hypothetical protein
MRELLLPASQLKSEPGLTAEKFDVNLNSARRSQIPRYLSIAISFGQSALLRATLQL